MKHLPANWERWKSPFLGALFCYLGFDLQWNLPSPFHLVGLVVTLSSLQMMGRHLDRCLVKPFLSLMFGGAVLYLTVLLVLYPHLREVRFLWLLLPALAPGTAGTYLHLKVLKNALGLFFAPRDRRGVG